MCLKLDRAQLNTISVLSVYCGGEDAGDAVRVSDYGMNLQRVNIIAQQGNQSCRDQMGTPQGKNCEAAEGLHTLNFLSLRDHCFSSTVPPPCHVVLCCLKTSESLEPETGRPAEVLWRALYPSFLSLASRLSSGRGLQGSNGGALAMLPCQVSKLPHGRVTLADG